MKEDSLIGKSLPRVDARAKVTGTARYTDDFTLPGMIHGRLLRSPLAHARIVSIDTSRAKAIPGVAAVITGADLPKVRYGNWRLMPSTQDEMALATSKVRYMGDEVAAVAAVDLDTADEALSLIKVEYEELPGFFDIDASLAPGAIAIHDETPGNISITRKIAYGDVDGAFAEADYVRTDVFDLPSVSHAYLEPCSTIAQSDTEGRITLISSTQTPYIIQCLLASALGMRENDVRVIKPAVGGGFGGKMELRSWDVCAAFIARLTGRPVKFTLTREEEFVAGRRRHGARIRARVGFKKDGALVAKECAVHLDGGAYNSMGPTATFLIGNFSAMLYRYPAFRYEGYHVYTNKSPAGAMRGLGAPQALFVTETQMNIAAEELGIDPIELRLKNAMRAGDTIPEVATVGTCAFAECLEEVRRKTNWTSKRAAPSGSGKGIGIGCYSFISGGVFNWFDTKYPFSAAEVRVYSDGTADLAIMAADIGQGSDSVLTQILAADLGLRIEDVRITSGDTGITPKADLGTWGSRVTMMAGNAVLAASRQVKEQLYRIVSLKYNANVIHEMECAAGVVRLKGRPDRAIPFGEAVALAQRANRGEPVIGRGSYTPRDMGLVTPAFSFGAQVIEVGVDMETGKVAVEKVTTSHDCGRMLNPMTVEGQVEGCIQMGLGYAISEELINQNGRMMNASFLDYKMPTALDMPVSEQSAIERDDPRGPFGAKETGEGPVSPTAPAIADAVWHATGFRCASLPISPEKILRGIGAM
jgi:4-hydroxybenzoyl-CoA reductase alpha subunit